MNSIAKTSRRRGRQVTGRIMKTEVFLRKVAAKLRARAEAHNLERGQAEDEKAGAALRQLSAACDRAAGELREPELPLG